VSSQAIEIVPTRFAEAKLLVRAAHRDERGTFRRVFSTSEYRSAGIHDEFVEDNVSISHRGVLRGLHFAAGLAKFVQVLHGEVFDVIADVRRASPSFGTWEAFRLTGHGCEQLYVPAGFAHGFYVLSESAVVAYKQTAPYDPSTEGQLRWNDPQVGVVWPLDGEPLLSPKDRDAPSLQEIGL
jgi:dTDP-4-dehydrorhamnose 3,5-epimerase